MTPSDHPLRAGLGLWSYTVCALAVKELFLGYAAQPGSPDDAIGWLLRDPNTMAAGLGGALVASGWALLLPRGARVLALGLTNLLISALMVADYFYLLHVGSLISLRDLLDLDTAGSIVDSVAAGLRPGYLLYFVDAIVIIVAVRSRGPAERGQSVVPRILAAAAATLVGVLLVAPTIDQTGDRQTKADTPHQSWPTPGVVPYHLLELLHRRSPSSLNAGESHVVRLRFAQRRRPRPVPAPFRDGTDAPFLGRMRLDLDGFSPLAIDCELPVVRHDENCDELRILQTAHVLFELSGRVLAGESTQRLSQSLDPPR